VLGDRAVERAVESLDAMAQQILKADEDRRGQIERLRLAHRVDDRNGHAVFLQRRHGEIAGLVHVEVAGAPAVDHVERRCVVDGPRLARLRQ